MRYSQKQTAPRELSARELRAIVEVATKHLQRLERKPPKPQAPRPTPRRAEVAVLTARVAKLRAEVALLSRLARATKKRDALRRVAR